MFICRLSKKKKRKCYKELEFTKLEFHKDIKNYLFLSLCLFVNYPKKKKKSCKGLMFTKLEFCITRNSSLMSLSTLEKK